MHPSVPSIHLPKHLCHREQFVLLYKFLKVTQTICMLHPDESQSLCTTLPTQQLSPAGLSQSAHLVAHIYMSIEHFQSLCLSSKILILFDHFLKKIKYFYVLTSIFYILIFITTVYMRIFCTYFFRNLVKIKLGCAHYLK